MPPTETTHPRIHFFSDELIANAWPRFVRSSRTRRITLLLLTLATFAIDYVTGPTIRFPAFYAPPILLAAWYDGFAWGCLTGFGIVFVRFSLERWIWPNVPWPLEHMVVTGLSAALMILIIVWYAARAGRLTREIRLLSGLLPICMHCHRIRNEKNEWVRLEGYIMDRSQAEFSHGICPTCADERATT